MNAQIQQQIINHLQTLHSFQLKEVLNFVMFIREKQNHFLPKASSFAGLRGKYRNSLSSSEVFAQRKLEEIKMEEASFQRSSKNM